MSFAWNPCGIAALPSVVLVDGAATSAASVPSGSVAQPVAINIMQNGEPPIARPAAAPAFAYATTTGCPPSHGLRPLVSAVGGSRPLLSQQLNVVGSPLASSSPLPPLPGYAILAPTVAPTTAGTMLLLDLGNTVAGSTADPATVPDPLINAELPRSRSATRTTYRVRRSLIAHELSNVGPLSPSTSFVPTRWLAVAAPGEAVGGGCVGPLPGGQMTVAAQQHPVGTLVTDPALLVDALHILFGHLETASLVVAAEAAEVLDKGYHYHWISDRSGGAAASALPYVYGSVITGAPGVPLATEPYHSHHHGYHSYHHQHYGSQPRLTLSSSLRARLDLPCATPRDALEAVDLMYHICLLLHADYGLGCGPGLLDELGGVVLDLLRPARRAAEAVSDNIVRASAAVAGVFRPAAALGVLGGASTTGVEAGAVGEGSATYVAAVRVKPMDLVLAYCFVWAPVPAPRQTETLRRVWNLLMPAERTWLLARLGEQAAAAAAVSSVNGMQRRVGRGGIGGADRRDRRHERGGQAAFMARTLREL